MFAGGCGRVVGDGGDAGVGVDGEGEGGGRGKEGSCVLRRRRVEASWRGRAMLLAAVEGGGSGCVCVGVCGRLGGYSGGGRGGG